ncbi:hypothetical protein MPTK1_1g25950 [Marchantia polymorpha subsp. ruderalis]|uniref:Uncharacterized protein n=2 Tax=Marchantia polymorpha TaxID=3197 RepID=A0AAF6AUC9_MARPO|nr:hypothetical protein MARPO_0002s0281 [Marchantia polymorpha]BBN00046.1 hypothetical protein Mp_1g25950 [Marchantia polymorpha subsp. ruderalis]PTQ49834.1 hypothetical protein MARPO_0002s0281 [Marchantia polymorpha]PTQ49835.1 hypothetical protein MARPO_0002s0281 [Marchantia polymorpha]PTQ49836.1 hypothetical protein MARPO_0002s0281 [Marchantia polymorpha]|eukprot:PTQ49833.1 hypothetical protein MARPO_0002s0281 [Marchantia polymorpha]
MHNHLNGRGTGRAANQSINQSRASQISPPLCIPQQSIPSSGRGGGGEVGLGDLLASARYVTTPSVWIRDHNGDEGCDGPTFSTSPQHFYSLLECFSRVNESLRHGHRRSQVGERSRSKQKHSIDPSSIARRSARSQAIPAIVEADDIMVMMVSNAPATTMSPFTVNLLFAISLGPPPAPLSCPSSKPSIIRFANKRTDLEGMARMAAIGEQQGSM